MAIVPGEDDPPGIEHGGADHGSAADAALDGSSISQDVFEDKSALELKAMGNEAYKCHELQMAVDLWNLALRRYVEEMERGSPVGTSPLSQESLHLERSLYLNLAQGYLRLENPSRALRACQVVLHDDAQNAKALYRGAEACMSLGRLDQSRGLLETLLAANADHAEGQRLLKRVVHMQQAQEKAAARKQKAMARAMCAGADFSEGRARANPESQVSGAARAAMDRMSRPETMVRGLEIAEAAAAAARRREARLAQSEQPQAPLPEPTTMSSLDAFRAKVMARTQKYNAHADMCRKKASNASRAVRLDWLRGGGQASGVKFDDFTAPLQEELRVIEAEERQKEEQRDDEAGAITSADGSTEASVATGRCAAPTAPVMEEMD